MESDTLKQQVGNDIDFNTFDIMRNYLSGDEMFQIIQYLIQKMNFRDINHFIMTANNITDLTFL